MQVGQIGPTSCIICEGCVFSVTCVQDRNDEAEGYRQIRSRERERSGIAPVRGRGGNGFKPDNDSRCTPGVSYDHGTSAREIGKPPTHMSNYIHEDLM